MRKFHVLCCAAYTLLCAAWRAIAGPGISWDQVHYHLYVAHAWWENRLPDELFAAGPQSYLNPLPHLPFYAAYQSETHGLVIGLTMVLLHSINLWLLHFIAYRLISPTNQMGRLVVVSSVLLGALSPAFQYEVGTSYTDVIVSIPAMGALLLLLHWQSRPLSVCVDWRLLYAAGVLAGIAIGLKPSALVFCATLVMALIVLSGRQAWSVAWRAMVSGVVGLALSGGGHAWMLWKTFGNPVFPLFNGVFKSPWFPLVDVVSHRFRPADLEAAMRFPLDMADSYKRVSFEGLVVDIRPMWLLGLVVCIVVVIVIKHFSLRQTRALARGDRSLFWVSLVLCIPAWIYTSGNIRYAIEPLLLLGPAIGLLAQSLIGKRHIFALLAILLPLTGQAVLATTLNTLQMTQFNWRDWRSEWFDVTIPEPLNRIPAYYLTLNANFASLATVFPSDSRFLNLIGSTNVPTDSIVLDAMENHRYVKKLPLRTLYEIKIGLNGQYDLKSQLDQKNSLLSEYGYKVKDNDCLVIKLNHNRDFVRTVERGNTTTPQNSASGREVLSCSVVKADTLSFVEKLRRQKVDLRIDHWAQKCPEVFSPLGFSSLQFLGERLRYFPSTETSIVELATGRLVVVYGGASRFLIDLEDKDGVSLVNGCPPKVAQ